MTVGRAESSEVQRIRNTVVEVHRVIDDVTRELRTLDPSSRSDLTRRAEEAGAALARLEWALDRSAE